MTGPRNIGVPIGNGYIWVAEDEEFGLGRCECGLPAVVAVANVRRTDTIQRYCPRHAEDVCLANLADGARCMERVHDQAGRLPLCWRHHRLLMDDANERARDLGRQLNETRRAHKLVLKRLRAGLPLRASVSEKMRLAVIRRDEQRCRYCLRRGTSVTKPREHGKPDYVSMDPDKHPWHIDHFIPVSGGGATRLDNLVLACARCNMQKGTKRWELESMASAGGEG